ncbi:MAG: HAD family hydrolase, partial [Erysipelotrichaceae bacterium]|nr:HAD family hydrolase [Erysipelotrichaceae bacterium]
LLAGGYKVGVNSNKNHNYTAHLIKLHFPDVEEEYVTGVRPGDRTKPDPENVNRVIDLMGLEKNEILYVGDSPTDYKTAVNAGTEFAGVSWGYRSKEVIMNAGAHTVVDSPEELLKYIKENEI